MRAGGREWLAVTTATFGLWVGACLDSGGGNNDNTVPAYDAGTMGGLADGGTMGGSPTGGTMGGSPTGGTTGGSPTGGTMGGLADGGTMGGSPTGGTTGGSPTGGTTGGSDAGMPGGTDAGPWMPPAQSLVKGTGGACLSTGAQMGDKCGSYYCGVSQATLTPELNPGKPCGDNPGYACKAELTAIVTEAAKMYSGDAVLDPEGFKSKVKAFVKMNPGVMANNVRDTCIDCFVGAAICCAGDLLACGLICTTGTQAECDAAQKAKGCITQVFECGGLPDPF